MANKASASNRNGRVRRKGLKPSLAGGGGLGEGKFLVPTLLHGNTWLTRDLCRIIIRIMLRAEVIWVYAK